MISMWINYNLRGSQYKHYLINESLNSLSNTHSWLLTMWSSCSYYPIHRLQAVLLWIAPWKEHGLEFAPSYQIYLETTPGDSGPMERDGTSPQTPPLTIIFPFTAVQQIFIRVKQLDHNTMKKNVSYPKTVAVWPSSVNISLSYEQPD